MLTRDLRLIYVSIFTQGFGYGLYFYLVPLYARSLGANPVQIGLIYTTFFLLAAITAIPGGLLADRISLKKVITYVWLAIIPAGIFYLIAPSWQYLIIANVFAGISMMNSPAVAVYISKKAQKGRLARSYTIVYSSFATGMVLSPALGGFIADIYNFKTVFGISTALFVLSSFIIFFISDEKPVSKKGERKIFLILSDKGFLATLFYFTFIFLFIYVSQPFLSPFLNEVRGYSLPVIGLLGAVSSFGAALIGPLTGHLADVYGRKTAMLGGLSLLILGIILLLSFKAFAVVFLAFVFFGVVEGFYTLSGAIISKQIQELPAGLAFGFFRFITLSAAFLGPFAGGIFYEVNPTVPFLITGIAIFILIIFTVISHIFRARGTDMFEEVEKKNRLVSKWGR